MNDVVKPKQESSALFKKVLDNDIFADSRSPFETFIDQEKLREKFFSDENYVKPIYSFRKNLDSKDYEDILEKIRMDAYVNLNQRVGGHDPMVARIQAHLANNLRMYHKLNPVSADFIFETQMIFVDQIKDNEVSSFMGFGFIYLIDVVTKRKCYYGYVLAVKRPRLSGIYNIEVQPNLLHHTYGAIKHPSGMELMLDNLLGLKNDPLALTHKEGVKTQLTTRKTDEALHMSIVRDIKTFSENLIDIVRISNYQTSIY